MQPPSGAHRFRLTKGEARRRLRLIVRPLDRSQHCGNASMKDSRFLSLGSHGHRRIAMRREFLLFVMMLAVAASSLLPGLPTEG